MINSEEHIRYEELTACYSLGILDPGEKAEFEAHLAAGCPACEAELAATNKLAAEMAHAAPSVPIPEGLKEKTLARIQKAAPVSPHTPREQALLRPKLAFGFGIAASLVAIYSGFTAIQLKKENQRITAEINLLRQELGATQARLTFALSPMNEVLELAGQPPSPQARGKVVFNAAARTGFFTASGLPQTSRDKGYQLWVIAGGQPVSLGVFKVDSSGAAEVEMGGLPAAEKISAFAVTLEPAGGVPLPTGDKYLAGVQPKI